MKIKEASVPPTDYGYWIKPLGEIVPVGNHGHEQYLRERGSDSPSAMRQGWIRVTTSHAFQAEACFTQVLPMAKSKLFLLAHQSRSQHFFVDNHGYDGGYSSHLFTSLIEFQHGIDKMMDEDEALTESILLSQPHRGYSTFHADCTEELDRLTAEYRSSNGRPRRWRVVSARLITMVWRDSAKLGFVRSSRAISSIADLFYKNIVALQVNNEIAEHDTMSKEEVLADYDFKDSEEMEEFVDWAIECETGWRISDYGIKHLIRYAAMLAEHPTDEEKLQICDAILNVVHPRSDLASWFVEGGSSTMDAISNQSLNENDELPGPLASLAQFLSDPRPIEDLYQTGDVLTYKGDLGEVTSHNERSVSLRMKDGSVRIVRRNDPDLEVAHHSLWRTMNESVGQRPYGYWVSPDGEAYPVEREQHDAAIYEIENISYGDAIYTGWARVVCPKSTGKWHIEVGGERSLPRATIAALRSMMDEKGAYIDVHNLSSSDPDNVLVSYMTQSPEQSIALLNAYRRGVLFTDERFIRFQI